MSNRNAQDYLAFLQAATLGEPGSVVYRSLAESGVKLLDNAKKQALAQMVDERYGVDHRDEMAQHGDDIYHWLKRTESNLFEDLARYVGEQQSETLNRLALGFIPYMTSNAFAEAVAHAPHEKIIGINLGLFWVSCLLAEAFLRAADGDEIGSLATYQSAEEVYLAQSQRQLHAAWNGRKHHANDAYAVQGGAVGSVLLRFVALHELGHVVLGHVGHWRMRFLPGQGRVVYESPQYSDVSAEQTMELDADAFALSCLLAHTEGPEVMWNNLLFIAAFFRLMARLEAVGAITPCKHHPPPLVRLGKLYEQTERALGPPPNDAWAWAAQLQNEWQERDG
ncbi:hypothetical protein VX159_08460 [Dechloromonas sp. ZY10]|uniref:ImmA/IrrE family metallo-endopeptidase n=1 Tax=Dechloromonas aquae TaxID=2664436 RepID=UPI0035297680